METFEEIRQKKKVPSFEDLRKGIPSFEELRGTPTAEPAVQEGVALRWDAAPQLPRQDVGLVPPRETLEAQPLEFPGPQDYNLPVIADPSEPPMGIEFPVPEQAREMKIGAAPEPTGWEKFKGFFVSEPRYGRWTKPTRLDYLHKALDLPLSILTPFASGRTLGADKLSWYALTKIRPDLANKPLEEQMAELSPYEKSGFQKVAGEIAEFIGQIQTSRKLLGAFGWKSPKGVRMVDRIARNAPPWMTSGAIDVLVKDIVEEKAAPEVAKDVIKQALIRGGEAIVWSGFEWGAGKAFGWALKKFPRFRIGWQKWVKGKKPAEKRAAREEVDAALKHYRKTGDRAAWDNVRIKYAGITPEGAEQIRARAAPPPPVREFGKYPLARPSAVAPTAPVKPPVRPVAAITPPKPTVTPPKVAEAVTEGKVYYHGSPTANLTEIKPAMGDYGKGVYFTTSKQQAIEYSKGRKALAAFVTGDSKVEPKAGVVYEIRPQLKNPLIIESKKHYTEIENAAEKAGFDIAQAHPERGIADYAKSLGYDGVIDTTSGEGIAFVDTAIQVVRPAPAEAVTEVEAKVPEGRVSRQPVTVEGEKYYPIALPTEQIGVDAAKFQFKLGAKLVGGVTEALKGVEKFDPVKGGQILVWQDNAGEYWVVDGHHRVALAKKTGAETLETWVVREADGVTEQKARAIGALRNLADGKGTAIDAAKLFRDSDISLEELRKNTVPTESTVVKQGLDMADLSDEVFRLVIDERLPANMAATIGKQVKNPAQQKQVADLIMEGEVETLRQAELLAATIDSAPILTKTEQTLFGVETTEKSLYAERAKVLANVEQKLKTNKKIFGVLATQTGIIEAKGNILAKVENLATKEKAEEVLFMLEKLANAKGPVAEALNDATKQYAKNPTKENLSKVTTILLERWTEGPGRLQIPVGEGVSELPLERVAGKVAVPTFEEIREAKPTAEIPARPLVDPKATALQRDKQLRAQAAWDKKFKPGRVNVEELAKVHKFVVNVIESAKPVEIKYGKEVSAAVIKGIHNVDVARIEFNEAEIENMDRSLDEYGKLLSRYSNKVLTNLMLARGKPKAPEAIALQKRALEELVKEAPELIGTRKMITRIGDFTHEYLRKVAGDEVKYVEDYYYGIYKDSKKVRRWLDHWTTTKRFLKEKKWFTVAEAMAVGQLELRDPNPVNNIRSEYMAIAHLEGMITMRDELLKLGKDKFISDDPALLADPEKIPDPVFKGLYVDEPLAQMIKNLISTSKVHKIAALNTLRKVNNVMRTVKFTGSMFHHLSVLKQSIVDSGYLGFLLPHRWVGIHRRPGKAIPYGLHKETAARGFTFGFKTDDPIFKTQFYRRVIRNGGGHRYSIESQAQRMITNSVDKFNSRISKPLKAALFVPQIPVQYVKWMFQSYIPKVKYEKTVDEYAKRTKKLGRDLTDGELQEIIKEGQNFYGMMNERLFGRSGTVTQLLRLRFMSPGYWFGNMRTIIKGAIQWGVGKQFKASRSRANILNSFIFTGMMATIGTLIMTGKPPKKPETAEDIRDIFKIDTGRVDIHGNRIMIDLMTYDKDYWNIYGKLIVGQAGEIPGEVWRRAGGMTALSFDILSDFNQMAMGKSIYDWKGDKVTEITDPFAQRVMSLVWHEFQKASPISVSVFSQARKRDLNNLQAGMLMLLGLRLTKTEKAKREQQILNRIFSLFDRQESLYYYLGNIKEPRKHVEHYNRIVNSIFNNPITTNAMRNKYYKGRIIDVDRLLENKAHYLSMQNRTPEEIEKTKKYMENFDVTPVQAKGYLRKYWQRERKKGFVSPLERDRVIGRLRKLKRLDKRMQEK